MSSILTARIVECVRDLNIRIVERDGTERVAVNGGSDDFPVRLIALQRALEDYDRATGAGVEQDADDHKIVLNALLARLVSLLGDDISPESVLRETVRDFGGGASAASKGASFDYKPNKKRKAGFKEDHLRPIEDLKTRGSLDKMRSDAFMASGALSGLGQALVAAYDFKKRSFERAQRDIQRRIDEQERLEDDADPGHPANNGF